MPQLETRTDSLRETPKVPQEPCQHWSGILRFLHRLYTRSYLERLPQVPGYTNVYTNVNIDAERILHVTNDVPENMRSALERILKSDAK